MSPKKNKEQLNLSLEDKLFTVRRKGYKDSHINNLDPALCKECVRRICLSICPAGVYVWDEKEQRPRISYEDCLECGTCWVACEMQNIEWTNPVAGCGISYRES